MNHPVTVALEICAIGVARLGVATSPAFFLRESVRSQHFQILNVLSLRSKPLEFSHLWLLRLGSCCSGLGARERREPLFNNCLSLRSKRPFSLSLRSEPLEYLNRGCRSSALVTSGSARESASPLTFENLALGELSKTTAFPVHPHEPCSYFVLAVRSNSFPIIAACALASSKGIRNS
jgi:hypothetical protein